MAWGQGRSPDKPGTFRIKPRMDGKWRLSGVREDGSRYRQTFGSESEAKQLAGVLFPAKKDDVLPAKTQWDETDDFGLPVSIKASGDSMASANAKLGIGTMAQPTPNGPIATATTALTKTIDENKLRNAKQAQSLMEMIGIAGAAGDVMLAVKITEGAGKDPVKPNPKQVNALADSLTDTLKGWFGDRDIKPWQMTILLGLGIPLTMLIQSKKKDKPKESEESPKSSVAK